ncbi:hypothetical protein F4818DRAFT_28614 [Hypoxylon cercidicola]|nr:hypothetical protein F4818DRAFT_28614 [Hypoxylon cercidicola]
MSVFCGCFFRVDFGIQGFRSRTRNMEPSDATHRTILPRMSFDSGDDFDFAPFLQDDDGGSFPASGGASGSAPALNNELGLSNIPPPEATASNNSIHRHRQERRGHTKSRRGCYNCKRRRIKCQETRPACGHCVKTGLRCEYPATPQVVHQPRHQVPLFSLQDMRFFQHFLLTCFPHHPLGNETIWTHEVPCLSQTHEYLMHAVLGLAASDLMTQDSSLVTFAMMHRVKAINAIKRSLSDVPKMDTFEEGNALIATCFALTFQSIVLDDGMAEYMTFIRGIALVSMHMYGKGVKFLFSNLQHLDTSAILKPHMDALPLVRRELVDMAVAGIHGLEPLCTHQVEVEYYKLILEIAEALYTDSFLAYRTLSKHYGWWMQIPHAQFRHLIDAGRPTCTLLAAHWIALKQVMAPVTETEYRVRAREPERSGAAGAGDSSNNSSSSSSIDHGMVRWLKHLNRQVDVPHRAYNGWPVWVETQLDKDARAFGRTRAFGKTAPRI